MLWLWRKQTIADDAGKTVPMFDVAAAMSAAGRKHDPALAEVAARIAASDSSQQGLNKPLNRWKIGFVVAYGLGVPVAAFVAAFWGVPIGYVGPFFALGLFVLLGAVVRAEMRGQEGSIRATMLAEGRCASCGYRVAELPGDERGLVTCAECGACWHASLVRTGAASIFPPGRAPDLWSRDVLTDLSGRMVRSADFRAAARADPSIAAVYRRARRATRGERWLQIPVGVGFGVFLWICGMLRVPRSLSFTVASLWDALLPIFCAYAGWHMLRHAWRIHRGPSAANTREMAHRLVRVDRCPACLGTLALDPDAEATRRCPVCGAHWSTRREDFDA